MINPQKLIIPSQVIIQLLSSDLIPPLTNMAKSGEVGRKKLEIIIRLFTLPLCLLQGYAVIALLLNSNSGIKVFGQSSLANVSPADVCTLIFMMAGGTYLALFIGDMIYKRGVGNGITLVIMSGIASSFISNFSVAFSTIETKLKGNDLGIVLSDIVYVFGFAIIFFAILFTNASIRKIPIQQTGQGLIKNIKDLPYLPIKLNSAGVIPVIFAQSILTIPGTIAQFLSNSTAKTIITNWFTFTSWFGIALYFLLIVAFTFFYSYVQINPAELSENFTKSGKFILGIKTGKDTEKYLSRILSRVNWIGAPFLGLIACLPYIISISTSIPSGIAIGGTGMIIMVTGSLEFWNALRAASITLNYSLIKRNIKSEFVDFVDKKKTEQLW